MPNLHIASYDVAIDLTGGPGTFWSRTQIRFGCSQPGTGAIADLRAVRIRRAMLNGADLHGSAAGDPGRLELDRLSGDNTLIAEAEFAYASSGGAGLLRETGPDGRTCVYTKAYRGGAPHIFCCFDQHDLRAPFTVSIRAPIGWSCLGNAPLTNRLPGSAAAVWTFAPTRPIAPYLFSLGAGLSAGPAFACQRHGSVLPIATHALPPAAARLEAAISAELFEQPLRYYEAALGVAYPDDKCDVAFVPRFDALAFGAPGLLTIREQVLDPEDKPEPYLYAVLAHELAHAWFGGLIEFWPPQHDWLEEALTTYLSRSALEAYRPGLAPWNAATSESLPDHAYAKDAASLRQLEAMIGRQAVMNGVGSLLRQHANGVASKDDLVQCWSRASGRDLRQWATEQLIPAPADQT